MHHISSASPNTFSLPPRLPTYGDLKAFGTKHYQKTCSDLTVRNRVSALNQFQHFCRHKDEGKIGSELDIGFDSTIFAWQEQMTLQGLAQRTIQDRLEYLLQWRELVVELASQSELPGDFRGALNEAIERRGVTNLYLSKETGIATMTLKFWREGTHQPTRNTEQNIKKLEAALRLPPSTLAQRLGYTITRYSVTRAAKEKRNQSTAYGERLRRQRKPEYRLNYLSAPPESIRAEWQLLLVHKTNPFRERASPREIWRCKPVELVGHKPCWSELYAGQLVPAAQAAWTYISRYLSWLALETKHGGRGMPAERVGTLGWLLNDAAMLQFMAWMQRRSDNKIHKGIAQVLNCAASLLRPGTGWLWLNPQLAHAFEEQDRPFGFNPKALSDEALQAAWQDRCKTVWQHYEKQAKTITTSKACVKSRDPKEPIADILALPQPLSALTGMLATLKRNPPWRTGTKRYAVWLRDVLLLSWLIANPLRVNHFSTMTYRRDNTGHLYQDAAGSWHYRCTAAEFKNSPGDYDVSLPDFVREAIEAYLRDARPLLAGATEGDYVFLPEKFANQTDTDRTGTPVPRTPGKWNSEAISTRVRVITLGLHGGLPPFGPHAFRHIVATDYLKRYPGAYQMVSHLLNDHLNTVIKEYGHVSPMDGLQAHYDAATLELGKCDGLNILQEL